MGPSVMAGVVTIVGCVPQHGAVLSSTKRPTPSVQRLQSTGQSALAGLYATSRVSDDGM